MVIKHFNVTVNGEVFKVEVEELNSSGVVASDYQANNKTIAEKQTTALPESVKTDEIKKTETKQPEQVDTPSAVSTEGNPVKAPMPGSIIEVKVNVGDTVKEDDVLVILEAMKMENEVTSPSSGKVMQVMVSKGSTVNSGETLLIIG